MEAAVLAEGPLVYTWACISPFPVLQNPRKLDMSNRSKLVSLRSVRWLQDLAIRRPGVRSRSVPLRYAHSMWKIVNDVTWTAGQTCRVVFLDMALTHGLKTRAMFEQGWRRPESIASKRHSWLR